jgi:mannitol-specific phosphotransferase system IIBC component
MKARSIAIIVALCVALVVPAPLLFAQQQQQQESQQDIERKMAALRAQLELIQKQAEMKGEMDAKQKAEFDKQYQATSKRVRELQDFTEKYCCE